MKPGVVVADEMFPEGAGPYTDLEEMLQEAFREEFIDEPHSGHSTTTRNNKNVDRVPEVLRSDRELEVQGGLLMDLAANEKSVHADFYNDFDDLFDDEDLQ
ncbi:hypothetical protein MTO96_018302 [Rhipicephalus appendiculatus]